MTRGDSSAVVTLCGVSKTYASHGHCCDALRDVTFTASRGEFSLLLGPSGSGKTTLLTLIAGFAPPSSGVIRLFGTEIASYAPHELQRLRARRIGFIFQAFLLIDAFTVGENVSLVPYFAGRHRASTRQRTTEALERVGIAPLAGKRPYELSHGERQRVAIARAVASDADLLLADEPTASLEASQAQDIIRLLHSYASDGGKCVIVASHDLRLRELADTIHHMEHGRLTTMDRAS
jgi:putative ABC transport system ATP-binding protein